MSAKRQRVKSWDSPWRAYNRSPPTPTPRPRNASPDFFDVREEDLQIARPRTPRVMVDTPYLFETSIDPEKTTNVTVDEDVVFTYPANRTPTPRMPTPPKFPTPPRRVNPRAVMSNIMNVVEQAPSQEAVTSEMNFTILREALAAKDLGRLRTALEGPLPMERVIGGTFLLQAIKGQWLDGVKALLSKFPQLAHQHIPGYPSPLQMAYVYLPKAVAELKSAGVDTSVVLFGMLDINKLNTYQLTGKELGRGAYGSVLEGQQQNGTKVAIKLFEVEHEFKDELNAAAALEGKCSSHRFVCLLDYVQQGPFFGVVYQIADTDLNTFLASNKDLIKNPVLFNNFVRFLLSAVRFLLDNSLVHRDIKPGNILVYLAKDTTGAVVLPLIKFSLGDLGSVCRLPTASAEFSRMPPCSANLINRTTTVFLPAHIKDAVERTKRYTSVEDQKWADVVGAAYCILLYLEKAELDFKIEGTSLRTLVGEIITAPTFLQSLAIFDRLYTIYSQAAVKQPRKRKADKN